MVRIYGTARRGMIPAGRGGWRLHEWAAVHLPLGGYDDHDIAASPQGAAFRCVGNEKVVLRLLAHALERYGRPRAIVLDRGKQFLAHESLQGPRLTYQSVHSGRTGDPGGLFAALPSPDEKEFGEVLPLRAA